jgi:integrase
MAELTEPKRRRSRERLTDKQVQDLPRGRRWNEREKEWEVVKGRYSYSDPEMPNHTLRVPLKGPIAYYATPRDGYGRMVWHKTGLATEITIAESRELAREAIKRIKAGLPATEPLPVKPDSFADVAQNWVKRHVRKNEHLTAGQTERIIELHLVPHLGTRPLVDIKRSEVAGLMDYLEDHAGPRMADRAYSIIRSIMDFHAERHDSYAVPLLRRAKKRYTAKARERILTDDEIRKIWAVAQTQGTFGALVKTLLCVGQRKALVLAMKWQDISFETGIWTIPRFSRRQKGDIGRVKLPEMVLDIIRALPRLAGNDHVFAAARGVNALGGYTKAKVVLDRKSGVSHWRLHDARRTHRSLAQRAGIDPRTAEIILGHAIKGPEGVYDRYSYFEEKSVGLARMAALIDGIVHGEPGGKVVPMRGRKGT